MTKYLFKRQDSHNYYVRIPVPLKLRPIIGRQSLKFSLKTGDKIAAEHYCRCAVAYVHTIFNHIKAGRYSNMTQAKIQAMIKQLIQQMLDDDMDYRINRDPVEPLINPYTGEDHTVSEELMIIDELKVKAHDQLVRSDYSEVRQMLASSDLKGTIEQLSEDKVNEVYHTFLRQLPSFYEVLERRAMGDFGQKDGNVSVKADDSPVVEKGVSAEPVPELTLKELLANFWQDRSSEWKPRTANEYRKSKEQLTEYLGEHTPVASINYESMKGYRKTLQDSNLSISRINLHIGFANQVFDHEIKTTGILRQSPAAGLKLKDKRRKDQLRDAFTIEDLGKLFVTGPGYKDDRFKTPSQFWCGLVSLYTGCRLEEFAQLYTDQIRKVDNTWCMVIDETHPGQSVKTSEKREVPLHPFLLELGLHRFAQEQPEGRLWPELKRVNNRYGHYLGRRFGDYKKKCGLGPKVTFHSFRGTVETELMEKDVDPIWINILIGHSIQGEGASRYLQRKPSVILEKAVSKLEWEQKLDLSALMNSRFTRS